jgi:HEAT repeat protein
VAVVQPLLEHGDECVQRAAAEALEFLEKDPAVQIATWAAHMERMGSFSAATEALRRIAIHSDATRLSSLVAGLEHANPAVRMAAMQALRNPPDVDMLDADDFAGGEAFSTPENSDVKPNVQSAFSAHGNRLARHSKQETDGVLPWKPTIVSETRCYCLICIQQRLSLVEAMA